MTENDRKLIEKAQSMHYTEWYMADELAEQADTPEARREIHLISQRLYHTEEYIGDRNFYD